MEREYIYPLSDRRASLENVGGKGASLARLSGAGFPVPGGFHISTEAYRAFVAANGLYDFVMETVQNTTGADPALLEAASQSIRERFLQSEIPGEIVSAIRLAYRALDGSKPVAVRSSATAEDLPEASFAGQQETFLNIRGEEALFNAVKKCWASLWTARAVAYRNKNRVDHSAVALAVVVQELVFADAAGILFTANPINGHRDEILINAAWGLGEAVVSGAVTPDTIVVKKDSGKVMQRKIAAKLVMTTRTDSGTLESPVPDELKLKPAIDTAQSLKLAQMGKKIEALYGMPMDVEWALAGGKFAILQARPITSLPPEWIGPNLKAVYARGSLAEHLPNPITPLFGTLGLRAVNQVTRELAQKLKFDANELEYQYRAINGYVYMGFLTDPVAMWHMVRGSSSALKSMFIGTRESWLAASEKRDEMTARWESAACTPAALAELSAADLLKGAEEVFTEVARLYTVLQSTTLPAATSSEMIFSQVYRMVQRKDGPNAAAFLHGFDTVPMKAERALFDLAVLAKNHAELAGALVQLPVEEAAALLKNDQVPAGVPEGVWGEWKSGFKAYLDTYGSMVYELDFANPTPAEMPELALDVVKMYLSDQGQNPYERQRAAVEKREQLTRSTLARLIWPVKGWFEKSLKWAQSAGPVREDCLVDLGKSHPLVRRLLGELGRRLAEGGAFGDREDIYWLEENEVLSLIKQMESGDPLPDLREIVAEREARWQKQLKLTPPAMLPEKSGWQVIVPWHRTDQGGNLLKGLGASAGKVTAPACVILGPTDFYKMKPGAVLVAVTTTPAWTPLFAMASAVVTDIGGPLSHGSIVAREYGIPAVMAAGLATRRIRDGQIVTVDGSAGQVVLAA